MTWKRISGCELSSACLRSCVVALARQAYSLHGERRSAYLDTELFHPLSLRIVPPLSETQPGGAYMRFVLTLHSSNCIVYIRR